MSNADSICCELPDSVVGEGGNQLLKITTVYTTKTGSQGCLLHVLDEESGEKYS